MIGVAPGQIGGEIVSRLSAEGASVVVGGRSLQHLSAVAGSASGVRAAIPVDLADEASVQGFFDAAAAELGGLDGFVGNAALYGRSGEDADALGIDLGSFDRLLQVNVRGQLIAVRSALPLLLAQGGGSIVLTGSIAAVLGEPTRVAYGIAKSAMLALSRHVAARWGKQGIRCNAVVPGRIVREDAGADPYLDRMLEIVPSPRLGRPGDIAAATAYLLSDDAAFVNGTHLLVDGGTSQVFAPAPRDDNDFTDRYPFSRSAVPGAPGRAAATGPEQREAAE
ncbi:MAG: SDR family oxidoreductase [Microbacterium sp.]